MRKLTTKSSFQVLQKTSDIRTYKQFKKIDSISSRCRLLAENLVHYLAACKIWGKERGELSKSF